jgi:hypothetical protein
MNSVYKAVEENLDASVFTSFYLHLFFLYSSLIFVSLFFMLKHLIIGIRAADVMVGRKANQSRRTSTQWKIERKHKRIQT